MIFAIDGGVGSARSPMSAMFVSGPAEGSPQRVTELQSRGCASTRHEGLTYLAALTPVQLLVTIFVVFSGRSVVLLGGLWRRRRQRRRQLPGFAWEPAALRRQGNRTNRKLNKS